MSESKSSSDQDKIYFEEYIHIDVNNIRKEQLNDWFEKLALDYTDFMTENDIQKLFGSFALFYTEKLGEFPCYAIFRENIQEKCRKSYFQSEHGREDLRDHYYDKLYW